MQKKYILIVFAMLLLVCDKPEEKSDKLLIAASIPPLADFVRNVGGDRVEVYTIVPAGVNPHTFELTPGVMKKLAAADLLVLNGVGLEFWLEEVLDNLAGKKATFTAAELPLLQDDVHHHAEGNPHVWLDPQNAIHQVKKIYYALADVDSANSSYYASNMTLYVRHLEIVDQDIQQMIDAWALKKFVCFHPAWEYFARRYGLEQAGVIEKRPGMEPSPQDIAEIIETVKRIGARAIFVEVQFPSRVANMIAEESDIAVVPLDPLGVQNESYVDLMRRNVAQMAQVMRELHARDN